MGRYNFNQRTRDGYEISPEQAAKWLERNDSNRNVNVAKVKKMAKDMREGHWDTTHQGIAIASDGTVIRRTNTETRKTEFLFIPRIVTSEQKTV